MDRIHAHRIVDQWMFPTEKSSYMGGLEDRPIIASTHDRTVTDIDGKEYLDFQSGQMGAAISHQHPRMVGSHQEGAGGERSCHQDHAQHTAAAAARATGQAAPRAIAEIPVPRKRQRFHRGINRPRPARQLTASTWLDCTPGCTAPRHTSHDPCRSTGTAASTPLSHPRLPPCLRLTAIAARSSSSIRVAIFNVWIRAWSSPTPISPASRPHSSASPS